MSTLNVQQIVHGGLSPSYVSCGGLPEGDEFVNNGRTFIHLKNTNISTWKVTVNSQKLCDQGHDHDLIVSIPLTDGERLIGPLSTARFNDGAGKVKLTYDGVSSLTIAVFELPAA